MSKQTIEELEAQVKQLATERDAVVAENVVLKAQKPKAWFVSIGESVTTDLSEAEKWRGHPLELLDIETPATDAILASLRAESMADGVIALADKVESLPYFVGVKQQFIRNFAAQLRRKSEVQS